MDRKGINEPIKIVYDCILMEGRGRKELSNAFKNKASMLWAKLTFDYRLLIMLATLNFHKQVKKIIIYPIFVNKTENVHLHTSDLLSKT